jgi:hypothetical protein
MFKALVKQVNSIDFGELKELNVNSLKIILELSLDLTNIIIVLVNQITLFLNINIFLNISVILELHLKSLASLSDKLVYLRDINNLIISKLDTWDINITERL